MKKIWIIISSICIFTIVYCLIKIYSVPKFLQSQSLAPDMEKYQKQNKFSTEFYIGEEQIATQNSGSKANLRAINNKYFSCYFTRLIDGRLFYKNEISNAAIVDKELAQALYPSISAIGKSIKIENNQFNIIGVVDKAPYTRYSKNVFIIDSYAQKIKLKPKIKIDSIDTGLQSRSEFLEDSVQDSLWDIPKEREKSLLIFKICLFIIGIMCINKFRSILSKNLKADYMKLKKLNENKYPREYLPSIISFVLKTLGGYLIIVALVSAGVYHLVWSVVHIPEYIPEILVDFKMIYTKYLENIQLNSQLFYVKSDVMIMIWHYAKVINTAFLLLLVSLTSVLFHERKKTNE